MWPKLFFFFGKGCDRPGLINFSMIERESYNLLTLGDIIKMCRHPELQLLRVFQLS